MQEELKTIQNLLVFIDRVPTTGTAEANELLRASTYLQEKYKSLQDALGVAEQVTEKVEPEKKK